MAERASVGWFGYKRGGVALAAIQPYVKYGKVGGNVKGNWELIHLGI